MIYNFPAQTTVQAGWGDGNKSQMLDAGNGKLYIVLLWQINSSP
jgi:hypothetical protein